MFGKLRSAYGIIRTVENWPRALVDHSGLSRKAYVCRLRNGLRFHIRAGTDDSRVFFEIHVRNCYGAARIRPGAAVIDIGANIGCYALLAARHAGRVLACEPHTDNLSLLRRNVELNRMINVEVIPCAVSACPGKALLIIPDDDALGGRFSLHQGRGERTTEVRSKTLDQIVEEAGLAEIDLIKIDCQGSEYEILYGTSRDTLSRVRQIVVECERFADHPRWSQEELAAFLERLGFVVVANGNLLFASREATHPDSPARWSSFR